jgi:hypothetical protein
MATVETTKMRHRQPARWGRNLVLLALLVAAMLTAWFWTRMRGTAQVRASYAAQTGCLCRFTAQRSLASCQGDPGIQQSWVGLHEDASAHSLTASVPLLATQTARWSPETGCVLDPWKD